MPTMTITTVPGLTPESGGPARSVTDLCTHLAGADLGIELCTLSFASRFGAPILPTSPWVRACGRSGRKTPLRLGQGS